MHLLTHAEEVGDNYNNHTEEAGKGEEAGDNYNNHTGGGVGGGG